MFVRWNPDKRGIHIIQHQPLEGSDYDIADRVDRLSKDLENPVAVVISLRANPSKEFSHVIKNSKITNLSRMKAILKNALKKYPQTEQVYIEGGEEITLFGRREF